MSLQKQSVLDEDRERRSYFERVKKEKTQREAKYWANIKNQYMIQPIWGGDGRVLVKIDGHKSKYDCTACKGTGHTDKVCGRCSGNKVYFDGTADIPCPTCTIGESDGRKTYGFQLCEQCKGKGGTIIIPDVSQKNADSGDVLAVSTTGINIVEPGMKVLIAAYTGIPFRFLETDLKVLVEKDILGIMKQLTNVTEGVQQGTYADIENVGVARED